MAQRIFFESGPHAVDAETARYDAGRGLLLKAIVTADFRRSMSIQRNQGLREQRGCALADYDDDGKYPVGGDSEWRSKALP